MTAIVGLVSGGRVYIGGDSSCIGGSTVSPIPTPKVFLRDGIAFGATGSFRAAHLLRYALDIPGLANGDDVLRWMVCDLVDAVRQCLRDGGAAKIEGGAEAGCNFLVGVRGRLFFVGGDYGVTESGYGFNACGAGDDYALGAMSALEQRGASDPVSNVIDALRIAEMHCVEVRGPFHVVATEAAPAPLAPP